MKYQLALSAMLLSFSGHVFSACALGPGDTTTLELKDGEPLAIESIITRNDSLYTRLDEKQKASPSACADNQYTTWQATHTLYCKNQDFSTDLALDDELSAMTNNWYKTKIEHSDKLIQCYEATIKGLELEKELRTDPADATAQADTKAKIDQYIAAINEVLTKTKEENKVAKAESKSGLKQLIKKLEEENKEGDYLANIRVDDNHIGSFFIGMNLMPKYNDEGKNEGFEEANIFGTLNLDLRDHPTGKLNPLDTYHIGVTTEFKSENVYDCETRKKNEPTLDCTIEINNLSSLEFNDISHTVDASVYGLFNFWLSEPGRAEIGLNTRYGLQSRDKLKPNGDSINRYHQVGMRWTGWDFSWRDQAGNLPEKSTNALPQFIFELNYAEYEDYAGLGKSYRTIFKSAYRPIREKPYYVGMNINGGEGPDEIELFVMFGLSPKNLLNL